MNAEQCCELVKDCFSLYTPSRQLRSSADTEVFRIPSSRIRSSGSLTRLQLPETNSQFLLPCLGNKLLGVATLSHCCHRVLAIRSSLLPPCLCVATVSRCCHRVLAIRSSLLPPCLAVVTVSWQQTPRCCHRVSLLPPCLGNKLLVVATVSRQYAPRCCQRDVCSTASASWGGVPRTRLKS